MNFCSIATHRPTLTANLTAELAALGQTVAVLDTDPQQSLVAWAGLGAGFLATCVTAVETTHPERFQAAVRAASQTATRVLIDTPPGFADPALLAALPPCRPPAPPRAPRPLRARALRLELPGGTAPGWGGFKRDERCWKRGLGRIQTR